MLVAQSKEAGTRREGCASLIDPLPLQPALNCSARLRQPLVIAAGAELRLINGVSVIAI
jgi:hypothetical protein